MRILVVEDDRFFAQAIREMLADIGCECECAYDAQSAVACNAADYGGAVIDVMLPNDSSESGISDMESRGGYAAGIGVARRLLGSNDALRIVMMTSGIVPTGAEEWAAERGVLLLEKNEPRWSIQREFSRAFRSSVARPSPMAFIVHGHDDGSLLQLKNFIQNALGWREPVVLRDQPSGGKTIIEKFEELAISIDIVFVLLTPDDLVTSAESNVEGRRSRQNVIFEMGFFCGLFGRTSRRVLLLHKGSVELPSDIAGVVWIDITNGLEAAGERIRTELHAFVQGWMRL